MSSSGQEWKDSDKACDGGGWVVWGGGAAASGSAAGEGGVRGGGGDPRRRGDRVASRKPTTRWAAAARARGCGGLGLQSSACRGGQRPAADCDARRAQERVSRVDDAGPEINMYMMDVTSSAW